MSNNYYLQTSPEVQSAVESGKFLTVYRKKSTFKGATENDFWYSATSKSGNSIILKFYCDIPEELKSAFIVFDIIGNSKKENITSKGKEYTNFTYYVRECKFSDIPAEELPF